MEPSTIAAGGWLHQFGGEVVAPEGHTCSKGLGNTLDFFIVSRGLRPFVKSIHIWQDAPISPHSPIIMVIGGVNKAAKSSQRIKWKPFPPRLPVGCMREAKLPT
eukprot:11155294-Heterocapsa_arctica.AAC.1